MRWVEVENGDGKSRKLKDERERKHGTRGARRELVRGTVAGSHGSESDTHSIS